MEHAPQNPLKRAERVVGQVDRGQPGDQPGVGELGDLGGQQGAGGVGVALVPAGARRAVVVLAEAGDVGGLGQVGRGGDEQRPAVVAQGQRVHVGAPGGQAGPVGRLVAGLAPHALRVAGHVEDAAVGEDLGGVLVQPEPVDVVGHRGRDGGQPVRQPVDQVIVAAQHAHGDAQVGLGLGRDGRRVGGRGLVDALVLHPVPGHELLADGPELLGVHGPGGAVAGRVDLAVAAALLGHEPGHARHVLGVRAAGHLQHGLGDRPPLHAVLGAVDPPAVGREPVDRGARDHAGGGPGVDAEVVPVDHEDQVVQAQAPGQVLGLVRRAGREPALALEHEDLDLVGPGQLEAERLARGGGMPCPEGPVLNFRNRVRPSISACPGRPPRRRSFRSYSQVSAQRPSSGKANSAAPVRSCRARIASLSTASVA